MITRQDLISILKKMDVNIAFMFWKKAPELPYIVYSKGNSNDLIADNQNYLHQYEIIIDLYQDDKIYDFELEKLLRKLLNDNTIPFTMSEIIHLSEERMYLTTLTVNVIEKE